MIKLPEPNAALGRTPVRVTASPATSRLEDTPEALTQSQDAELIERMTRGDRAALARLYDRHAHTLLALAQGVLRDRQEAEDLLHDVFLEAWRCAADYSAARSSVRSWLLMRTRSRALDRLRKRTRKLNMALDVARSAASEQAGSSEASVDQHRLPAALAQMPQAQQGVIMLAYFEGLSTSEISTRLGIPAGTVKSRTHAALKTLRSVLGITDE